MNRVRLNMWCNFCNINKIIEGLVKVNGQEISVTKLSDFGWLIKAFFISLSQIIKVERVKVLVSSLWAL